MIGRRTALAIFAAAFLPRLVFVLWAPGEPAADGIFYRIYGEAIARGWGYVDVDGSPVVRWMPGWPLDSAFARTSGGSRCSVSVARAEPVP